MKAERAVFGCFVVSALCSAGLVALYISGGHNQLEGLLLAGALGGLGTGIAVWATRLMDTPEEVEERHPLASDDVDHAPDAPEVTRRTLLVRSLLGAGGFLAGALAIPALSLGPEPGRTLFRTKWMAGARVVDAMGEPVRPTDIPSGGVVTVFPEGHEGSADSQTVIVKVEPADLQLEGERATWAPEGCVGYSKICTHAGCPVGLYRADAHELLCPCHQSAFDVLRGAVPIAGPAARALPQLPLEVDDFGYLVARGDFTEPVGPSFWNVTDEDAG